MLFRTPFGKSFVTIFCIALWAYKMGREKMDKGKECTKIGARMVKGGEDYERLERNCATFLRIRKPLQS